MHKWALPLIALAVCAQRLPAPLEDVRPPVELAVVATLEDLRKQPEINFSGGTCRLGIEALSGSHHAGVMLYCLLEEGHIENNADTEYALGPFTVEVKNENIMEMEKAQIRQDRGGLASKDALFLQTVPLAELGRHFITIKDERQRIIANAVVDNFDAGYHPWMALEPSDDSDQQKDEAVPVIKLQFGCDGPAWPKLDGHRRIELTGGRLPSLLRRNCEVTGAAATDPKIASLIEQLGDDEFSVREEATRQLGETDANILPQLTAALAATKDAEVITRLRALINRHTYDFHIERRGDEILMPGFDLCAASPEKRLLVRWWVNGRPYVPEAALQKAQELRRLRDTAKAERVRLQIKVSAADLNAQPGDTVGLQLMYCPDGHESMTVQMIEEKLINERKETSHATPVVSNRVQFILKD